MSTSAAQIPQLQTIHISDVCKSYGDYPVLKNIDAEVARGGGGHLRAFRLGKIHTDPDDQPA